MEQTSSDKRDNSRVKVSYSCTFGPTEDTPRSGTVTSISQSGCFVKTRAWAEKGARMYLKIWLPEQNWLSLTTSVLYHLEQIGFGVGFEELTPEAESKLHALIENAQRSGEGG